MKKLDFVRFGGVTKRYHTVDTLLSQSVATHSFGVAWLCEILTDGKASKVLIMAALAHDLAEHLVGDIPSPSKRAMGVGAQFHAHEADLLERHDLGYEAGLSVDERRILKMSDALEGMMYCIRERMLGNKNVDVMYGRYESYVMEQNIEEHEMEIIAYVDKQWKELVQ